MILALWLVALGVADPAVTYDRVPAEVVRIQVYDWREESIPLETPAAVDRAGDVVSILGRSGANVIVVFARADGAYLIDGPFRWPDTVTRRVLDPRWRRSITVDASGIAADEHTIRWLSAEAEADAWTRCVGEAVRVTCWGVRVGAVGVAYFESQGRLWSAVVGGQTRFRSSAWGRLLIVRGPSPDANARVRLRHPVASAQRSRSVRLETQDVGQAASVPVGKSAIWIAGNDIPDDAWVEVQVVGSGPVYLPMRDVAEGPASLPVHVAVPDSRAIDGAVSGRGDVPAAGSVVTLFRQFQERPTTTRDRDPPRRVFVAEKTTDAGGAFRFEQLGEADYEIVAWHPQFGRASIAVTPGRDRVHIHLQSAGVVRGRVLSGGRPVEGVDVIGVPDQEAARNAADLLDLKGGDARTGRDGRFTVFLASAGGELRLGGGRFPVRRMALPRGTDLSLDLGDIELGAPIAISVVLDDDPACSVRAAGPAGRTGLQVVRGNRVAPGLHTVIIPEPGVWEFGLSCGQQEHALSPGVMEILPAMSGKEVRFTVRN